MCCRDERAKFGQAAGGGSSQHEEVRMGQREMPGERGEVGGGAAVLVVDQETVRRVVDDVVIAVVSGGALEEKRGGKDACLVQAVEDRLLEPDCVVRDRETDDGVGRRR